MSADAQNFYYALTPAPAPHPVLAGEHTVDVCVVGGGISGISAALHLAGRGLSVALLEAKHVGYGGSGRSGGQSIMGYACEQSTLEKAVGAADARRMWDISIEGLDAAARADREAFDRLRIRARPHDPRNEAPAR